VSVAGFLFDVIGRHRKDTRVIFHDPESRNMGQGRTDATRLPSVKKWSWFSAGRTAVRQARQLIVL